VTCTFAGYANAPTNVLLLSKFLRYKRHRCKVHRVNISDQKFSEGLHHARVIFPSPPEKADLPYSHSETGLVFYQAESIISLGKKQPEREASAAELYSFNN